MKTLSCIPEGRVRSKLVFFKWQVPGYDSLIESAFQRQSFRL